MLTPQVSPTQFRLRYLVMPDSIYADNRLTSVELKVYCFIHSYKGDGFYFSNIDMAVMFNVTHWTISAAIGKLKKYGYITYKIEVKAKGGQVRFILDLLSDTATTPSPTRPNSLVVYIKDNKIKDNKINNIYTHWNSLGGVRKHEKLTSKMIDRATKAFNDYSEEEIKNSMSNYSFILTNDGYWKYKWSFGDFLSSAMDKFTDLETAKENYKNKTNNNNYKSSNKAPANKYDKL